jgi:hypothetical protein
MEWRRKVEREDRQTPIEKMLGKSFMMVSDPRLAKYPLPEIPENWDRSKPYPHPTQTITPDMAMDILRYRAIELDRIPKEIRHSEMVANRRIMPGALTGTRRRKGLIQILRDGEWNEGTASPIQFSADGFLLDGQHRIAACALSKHPEICPTGVAIKVPVTDCVPWDTFAVTDVGRGRNAGNLLRMKYSAYIGGAAKLILPVLHGDERLRWSYTEATTAECVTLGQQWPLFDSRWVTEIMKATTHLHIPTTPLLATVIMALAAGGDKVSDDVQQFLNGLSIDFEEGYHWPYGDGKDPRYMLKTMYLRKKAGSKNLTDADRRLATAHIRRALEIWLERKSDRPINLQKLPNPGDKELLPEVWRADDVRTYHLEVTA